MVHRDYSVIYSIYIIKNLCDLLSYGAHKEMLRRMLETDSLSLSSTQ